MKPLWIFALLSVGALARAADSPAPGVNWVLPLFSDKEGFRLMTARGSAVRPLGSTGVTVTDLSLTVFSGDATARVETILLSPLANFLPKDQRANGDRAVRIIRDDLEAAGTRWTYDHARKHVTLEGNVRIVFNAELKNLLK